MKIFTHYKQTGINQEIAILQQVLCSAHIEYKKGREFGTDEEYRAHLISQLTGIPRLIDSLFESQPAAIASNEAYLKAELERKMEKIGDLEKRLDEVQIKGNEDYKTFEAKIKALEEENEFLRNTKEKIYIMRERI